VLQGKNMVDLVDWTVFDKFPKETLRCRCGQHWRSHCKFVVSRGRVIARQPCPNCNRDDKVVEVRGDPELFTL
jgi:hypothetical protein